jgi:branched-chain amino acid aminotransferase
MTIQNQAVRRPPAAPLNPKELVFGKNFTPNWFVAEYRNGAWGGARIEELQPIQVHPAALVFHYAQAIFEGMKAYRWPDGRVTLFRPEMNARRMNASARRMEMPAIPEGLFLEALRELVDTEREWVPSEPGSLYIRPTMVASEACIGVRAATEFLFYVMTLPTGAYFRESSGLDQTIKVLVSESVGRAARGGTGGVKAAANYAITLKAIKDASQHGCAQVMFLDARGTGNIEEMGGMNVMFVLDGKLVTPPLSDTILAGVTRDSLLQLARRQGIAVEERPVSIEEIYDGIESGRLTEALACGTAAVIAAIGRFRREDGGEIAVGDGSAGPVARALYDELTGIQYGRRPDPCGWTREVAALQAK